MSAPREWKLTSVRRADSGPSQSAMEIRCGSCGTTDHIVNTGHQKIRPPDVLRNKWQAKGWIVGAGPAADRCPSCAAKLASRPKATVIPIAKTEEQTMPSPQPAVPREPTFSDKRIIIAKLEEVYIDEKTGYDRGWSDKRVADDLGVPKAWVAEQREASFGPARDNEDVRDVLEKIRAVTVETMVLQSEAAGFVERARKIADDVEALAKIADQIRKAVC